MRFPIAPITSIAAPLLLLALIPSAHGHAAWTTPRCRGTLNTVSITVPDLGLDDAARDDCPHCLNGGGKGGVMKAAKNNWRLWEPMDRSKPMRLDAGMCGDPLADPAPRPHERGGKFGPPKSMPFSAVYKQGQTVQFEVDVTTNHNGFFEFFICNVANCGGDINEKCFEDGYCRQMMRTPVPECESQKSKDCGPIDPDYPGRWVMPCRKGNHVGEHFMGGKNMQYDLPKDFACDDCVIQWYWATANGCNPPGFIEYFDKFPMLMWGSCPGDGGAKGARNPVLATCGGPLFPEEFWSCADVQVKGDGAGAPIPLDPRKGDPRNPPVNSPVPPVGSKPEPAPSSSPASSPIGRDPVNREPINQEPINREPVPSPSREPVNQEPINREPAPSPSVEPTPVNREPVRREPINKEPVNRKPAPSGNPSPTPIDAVKDCEKLHFRDPEETKPDPINAKCAKNWKQCGGTFFKGPTDCCHPRFECITVNMYFAQCKAPTRKGAFREYRK